MKWLPRLFARKSPARSLVLADIIRPEAQMRWLTPRLAQITPDYIENLLRGALGGGHVQQWELFDIMEDTWPRLAKNLNEIKRAVSRLNWKIDAWAEEDTAPTPEAEERAKLVSAALWKMRPAVDRNENALEGTIYDLLDAWGKGVSVLEILWDAKEKAITPRATVWVHPTNYGWHHEGWLGLRTTPDIGQGIFTQSSPRDLEPLPEEKFLVALCKARTAHPSAAALLRPLAWWWCAANFSASWLLNFAQIFGLPIRWATYDPHTPGLLEKVMAMLENMGSAAWAAFPAGTQMELKEPAKSGGGSDSPQGNLLDRADKQCDTLILGQTLTSDVGDSGSRALGEVHSDVRSDVILAAADFVAGIINRQFIPSILRLNYGEDDQAPEICGEPNKQEDAKANAERDQILMAAGIDMPKAWFYERHKIPLPQKGEETISGQASAQSTTEVPKNPMEQTLSETLSNEPTMQAKAGNPLPDRTFKQVVADAAGAREKWLAPVSEEIDRLARLADDEQLSAEEIIRFLELAAKRLPDLFADLDQTDFVSRVETALGTAALAGVEDASKQINQAQ
jgi:phage gp29-like protein